uniref:DUF6917 domain-containing protein n=1 Tax=Candidatus Kentrum sp. LPFa TaxID=2126335 RepID=A0A450VXL6_9GAMM|nr:MAG: hypothetical protein BECKLPF1236A_GA0070988_100256 [Candidatus Kentron sp. LPFa]VFK25592.1 MAG: hypothetical protein BECKLPF1236C_GA0070990_100237 [Candidatus Kentron sp. LPFa]
MASEICPEKQYSLANTNYIATMTFARIDARFVAVMAHETPGRGMIPSPYHTRCIQAGEIHELAYVKGNTDGTVNLNDVWYLGFVEFLQGGVLAKGTRLGFQGRTMGTLVAFDETHAPNHLNILISTLEPKTGRKLDINIGALCTFFYPSN